MQNRTDPAAVSITRARLRQLAEQFAVEYAGAVAPGRVMRLVFTTGRRLQMQGLDGDDLLCLTKASVRTALVTIIGEAIAHGLSGDLTYPRDAGQLRLAFGAPLPAEAAPRAEAPAVMPREAVVVQRRR